jgi:hypothetical protein
VFAVTGLRGGFYRKATDEAFFLLFTHVFTCRDNQPPDTFGWS